METDDTNDVLVTNDAGEVMPDAAADNEPPPGEEPPPGDDAPDGDAKPKGYDVFAEDADLPWLHQFGADEEEPRGPTREEIDALPHTAKQAIYFMRKGFNQKMNGLADREREYARLAEEHQRNQSEFAEQRVKFFEMFDNESLLAALKPAEGIDPANPPPPHTAEGQAFLVQQQVKEALEGFLGGLKGLGEKQKEQLEQRRLELEGERREAEVRKFIAEHDDFDDYRTDIVELRKQHPTMSAEQAYEFLKAKAGASTSRPASPVRQARHRAQHVVARKSRGNEQPVPVPPKGLSLAEYHEWMEQHPEAQAAELARIRRRLHR